jgi:hypothetical protein
MLGVFRANDRFVMPKPVSAASDPLLVSGRRVEGMVRPIAAIFVALCINPSPVGAQTTAMKVTVASAEVYLSPSTGSPVIGHVPRNTVLVVTRELGSWVKVPWPDGESGAGYVHVSKGTIVRGSQADDRAGTSTPQSTQQAARRTSSTSDAGAAPASQARQPVLQNPVYVTPPSHEVGVGGLLAGPNAGFGASARAWRRDRFGVQFDVSRFGVTNALTPGRVTSVQFEPSGLYSLKDHVTDYWWLRPYVGAGVSIQRQTFTNGTTGTVEPVSDSSLGFHVFGGGEVTFASMPRFTMSADVNYRRLRTPFTGFDAGGFSVAVSGRWYVR